MVGWFWGLLSPSAPSVRHWDRLWSSAVEGEGELVGCFGLACSPSPLIPLPSRERGIGGCVGLFTRVALPPLWIDESPITLCQRVRLQRRRTLFFIILVSINGRIKSAMTVCRDSLVIGGDFVV